MSIDASRDPRLERDMRVYMAALATRISATRAAELAEEVIDRAARMPGPPSSESWFRAWRAVLDEKGTTSDRAAAAYALGLVKKLWDAGL